VMGLYEAHKKFGKRPWASLLNSAIVHAERGFTVTEELASYTREKSKNFNAHAKKYFSVDGRLLEVGDSFEQPQLANALKLIQRKGADGFYKGDVASDIVKTVAETKGILTGEDLQAYEVRWLLPLRAKIFGADIYTMPPPSSGGPLLLTQLKLSEKLKLSENPAFGKQELHLMGEILSRTFFDRQYIADEGFSPFKAAQIFDDQRVEKWAGSIYKERKTGFFPNAFELGAKGGTEPEATPQAPKEKDNTTHYVVVDSKGNAVSATTTINGTYGSGVATKKFGIMLNNEMDDFTTRPGEANMFGLTQSALNNIAPGKTPLSSMTPTIIEKGGKFLMAVGSPGGPRIISSVYQTVYRALTSKMNLDEIVQAPRIHHQHSPDKLFYEPMISPDTREGLAAMGHTLEEYTPIGRVYSIRMTADGLLEGAFDAREEGGASAY
jgi:gamma-glutamyltranspeptidase / glutathione hydrolase